MGIALIMSKILTKIDFYHIFVAYSQFWLKSYGL